MPPKKDSAQPNTLSLSILFADDEPGLQELMRSELPRLGHTVTVCPDGITAVAAMERNDYDCLLVDLDMPGMNGLEVIRVAKQLHPGIEAIVITGKGSKETAIEAIRENVFDYLTKPCRLAELATVLGRVAQQRTLSRQVAALKWRLQRAEGDGRLIGTHKSIEYVRKMVAKVAPTESTAMIRGETGCGKELVARAVHDQSPRASKPFVAVNCGALPENLIESELFGHCRGAFTGADSARVGLFEMANEGTIFLDEIGELPLPMQAKLLRVLESGEIRRIGDNQTKKIDVRIVCATHRDLEGMVQEGTFREDLLFRINTFEIHVPPLRERTSDILPLATYLFRRFRNDPRSDEALFSPETQKLLLEHPWPGNVRELANVVEHASILCDDLPIEPEHLPRQFNTLSRKMGGKGLEGTGDGLKGTGDVSPIPPKFGNSLGARREECAQVKCDSIDNGAYHPSTETAASGTMNLRDLEMAAIEEALRRHGGNKPAAANELGISLKTLYNKLNASASRRLAS